MGRLLGFYAATMICMFLRALRTRYCKGREESMAAACSRIILPPSCSEGAFWKVLNGQEVLVTWTKIPWYRVYSIIEVWMQSRDSRTILQIIFLFCLAVTRCGEGNGGFPEVRYELEA